MKQTLATLLILLFSVATLAKPVKKPAAKVTTTTTTTVETVTVEPVEATTEPSFGEKAKDAAVRAKEAVQETVAEGVERRDTSNLVIMGEWSPIDLLIPSKIGGVIGYVQNRQSTLEAEYLGASYKVPAFIEDIGSFTDKRISVVQRVYGERNSFNFHYGLSYFDTNITVGSQYLASATNTSAYAELMKHQSIGFIVGIGNRWTFGNGFTAGVDWISYAQPLFVIDQNSEIINAIQDQNVKQKLQDVFQASMFFPRFSLLKVGIGWTF
jgi:hypothetical protein